MEIDTKIAEWQRRFGEVVAGQAKTAGELRSIPTDELHQRSLSFSGEIAAIRSEIEDTLVELPIGKAINCGEYQALVELARLNGVKESRVLGGVEEVSGGADNKDQLVRLGADRYLPPGWACCAGGDLPLPQPANRHYPPGWACCVGESLPQQQPANRHLPLGRAYWVGVASDV